MKVTLAIANGSTYGGCNTVLIGTSNVLDELTKVSEIVYWPYFIDQKDKDLGEIKEIDFGIFIGSVRTDRHKKTVEMLRAKCKVFVSFGSAACYGGIFGLSNSVPTYTLLARVFKNSLTTENASLPRVEQKEGEADLGVPELTKFLQPVGNFVDVDISIPGCPPPDTSIEQLLEILKSYQSKKTLPEKTIIAEEKSLCDICPRHKPDEIRLENFTRIHNAPLNDEECFLAQGVICLGPVTRAGCGARCIKSNMPCRGCFGPVPHVTDQGTRMLTAIATVFRAGSEKEVGEEELNNLLSNVRDPLGLFYLYSLASSIIDRRYGDLGVDDNE